MKKDTLTLILFVLVVIAAIVVGISIFQGCYSEHRDMGFSFWTSMTACTN